MNSLKYWYLESKCNNNHVLNNKKKCIKCPKNLIKRDKYKTKKGNYVPSRCIKNRGLPGKTTLRYYNKKTGKVTGIGFLKKGELGKHGYHHIQQLSKQKRHSSLTKAVEEYGAQKILKKLGALRVYQKNTSPKISNIFYEDQKWVRKKYDNQFQSDLKNSKLYNGN